MTKRQSTKRKRGKFWVMAGWRPFDRSRRPHSCVRANNFNYKQSRTKNECLRVARFVSDCREKLVLHLQSKPTHWKKPDLEGLVHYIILYIVNLIVKPIRANSVYNKVERKQWYKGWMISELRVQSIALTKIQTPKKQWLLHCVLFIPIGIRITFNFHPFLWEIALLAPAKAKLSVTMRKIVWPNNAFKIHSFPNMKTINLISNLRVSFVSLKGRNTSRLLLPAKSRAAEKALHMPERNSATPSSVTPTPTC